MTWSIGFWIAREKTTNELELVQCIEWSKRTPLVLLTFGWDSQVDIDKYEPIRKLDDLEVLALKGKR